MRVNTKRYLLGRLLKQGFENLYDHTSTTDFSVGVATTIAAPEIKRSRPRLLPIMSKHPQELESLTNSSVRCLLFTPDTYVYVGPVSK